MGLPNVGFKGLTNVPVNIHLNFFWQTLAKHLPDICLLIVSNVWRIDMNIDKIEKSKFTYNFDGSLIFECVHFGLAAEWYKVLIAVLWPLMV